MTFEFTGIGFDFQHVADDRGGIWQFVIDGDTESAVTVSTWNASTKTKKVEITRTLTKGTHTVVATFMGADPEHAPSSGNPRGWITFNNGSDAGKETFDIYNSLTNQKRVSCWI